MTKKIEKPEKAERTRTEAQQKYVELVKDVLRLQRAPKIEESVVALDNASFIDFPSMTQAQPVDAMSILYTTVKDTVTNNLQAARPEEGKPLPMNFDAGEGDRRCLGILSSSSRAQQYRDMILRSLPKVTNWVFETKGCEVWARKVM